MKQEAPSTNMLPIDDSGWLNFFGKLYIWSTLAAIVFGAVALLASNGIRVFSERIGRVQNKQIADANERASKADERAGEANKQAGLAHERAAKLETRASEAESQTKRAEAEVAKANAASQEAVAKVAGAEAQIAEANARAAEAQRVAESERLERLRLEAQISPRSLSLEQQRAIGLALSRFAGRRVNVTTYALDGEAAMLGQQIIGLLRSARIEVGDNTASMMPFGGFAFGVHVSGSEVEFAAGIANALASIGRLAVAPPNSSGDASATAISILVGVKPVPIIGRQ